MRERYTLVSKAFTYEDWLDLSKRLGPEFKIYGTNGGKENIPIGYDAGEGMFSTSLNRYELEEELYKFAVKRRHILMDALGRSFTIDWLRMPQQETRELLIELCGFYAKDFVVSEGV